MKWFHPLKERTKELCVGELERGVLAHSGGYVLGETTSESAFMEGCDHRHNTEPKLTAEHGDQAAIQTQIVLERTKVFSL